MPGKPHTLGHPTKAYIDDTLGLVYRTPNVRLGKVPIAVITSPYMRQHTHGTHKKNGVCLHETVSSDIHGLADIRGVAQYLAAKDYGIYAVIDVEANVACALGLGEAVFWHADSSGRRTGHVNHQKIGIELVSRVMLQAPSNKVRRRLWAQRQAQLRRAAQLVATLSRIHGFPLHASAGDPPGVTTHWEVTHTFQVAGGHTDCWPIDRGGYFPRNEIVAMAKGYRKLGY